MISGIGEYGKASLFQIGGAMNRLGFAACLVQSGQQHSRQNGDDRNYN